MAIRVAYLGEKVSNTGKALHPFKIKFWNGRSKGKIDYRTIYALNMKEAISEAEKIRNEQFIGRMIFVYQATGH